MHVTASRVPSRGTSTTRKNSIRSACEVLLFSLRKEIPIQNLGLHYWRENLESPVLFHEAVSEMVTVMQPEVLVEIGPHSALMAPLRQISKSMSSDIKSLEYLSAIKRNSNNVKDMLELAGTFFVKGHHIDLTRVNAVEDDDSGKPWVGKTVIDLPHYQWQYPENILLHEDRYTKEWRLRMHPRHDVLGSRIPGGAKTEPVWRNILRSKDIAWLGDHRVSHLSLPDVLLEPVLILRISPWIKMGYGIAEDHIFDSRDPFSAQAIMDHTSGRGVDIILCSARGQLMHDYWRCIATCGRLVEIGRTEVLDNGKSQLDVFRRNATITSFDLEVMSTTRPDIISR